MVKRLDVRIRTARLVGGSLAIFVQNMRQSLYDSILLFTKIISYANISNSFTYLFEIETYLKFG